MSPLLAAHDTHRLLSAFAAVARAAAAVAAQDLPFHRALDRAFAASLDRSAASLAAVARALLLLADPACPLPPPDPALPADWTDVVDVVDSLLEHADTALDEFAGARSRPAPHVHHAARAPQRPRLDPALCNALILPRPQDAFAVPPANSSALPFQHALSSKPHAIVPLPPHPGPTLLHPYDFEVWNAQYPCRVAQIADPLPYPPFDTTSAIWVGDPPALSAMLAQLKTCSEIAVDLEHHDYRSFAGFVCLMQISSRDQDWIVDTLLLRQELQSLNAVFADPAILKVFHGARMDILWLQRDFSLYIVSLFDTFHAAKSLHLSSRSLAFLLKRYADFDADKKYQLADWRIRPLPQEMLAYARSDTHFLLFVYDNLRNQLVQNDRLQHVLTASRAVAAQSYQRPAYDPDGWKSLYAKYGSAKLLSNTQIAAFTALHQWRDRIARHLDESLRYVLPTHLMVSIAAALPKDLPQLYACTLPPVAKDYANDILQLVSAHHSDSYHSDSLHSDSLHSDSHHSDSHHSDSHSRPDSHHSDSHSRPELLASISSFWTSLHQNEPNHNLLKQLGSQLRVAVPLPCSPKVEAAALAVHPFKPTPDDIIIPRTGKKRSLQILPYENLQPVHTRKKKKHRLEETSSLDPHKKLPFEKLPFDPHAGIHSMAKRPIVGKSSMLGKSKTFEY